MNIQKDNLTKNYFREWGKHFFSSTNEIYCVYKFYFYFLFYTDCTNIRRKLQNQLFTLTSDSVLKKKKKKKKNDETNKNTSTFTMTK